MITSLGDKSNLEILKRNYVGHLAYIEQSSPYVVPITYFYDEERERIISYASKGHKIEAMRKNKRVSLCVDEIETVSNWKSILVHGEFQEVRGSDAKMLLHRFTEGVKDLIARKEHRNLHFISEFSSKMQFGGTPIVYTLQVLEITGRIRSGNSE